MDLLPEPANEIRVSTARRLSPEMVQMIRDNARCVLVVINFNKVMHMVKVKLQVCFFLAEQTITEGSLHHKATNQ